MPNAPKSILDPSFRYVPSVATDIRETFARARGIAVADSWESRLAIVKCADGTFRVAGRRNLNPISPAFVDVDNAREWAREFHDSAKAA